MVAALYSANGNLYSSFVRNGEAPPPLLPPPAGLRSSGERLEFVQPVERNGEVLGTIYLRARYDVVERIETYAGIFALGAVLSMVVAYLLSRKMQKGITDPLDAIASVAGAIINGSDYSLRASKISDDEFGVVVDAFNKMLDEVQSRTLALSEADRRKDEFLATLAHELRNPLAPIRHAVKVLESTRGDEPQRQWAREVISRQVQRMALLLDDLLDVSRITRGRLDLKVEPIDLESLIRAAVETARPLIESKRHQLTIDLPSRRLTLAVDPLRMSQSLSNLLTNAAKYTDSRGQITLEARETATDLTLCVKDTGIGFEPESLPEIFEMFSQVDSAVAHSEGGLGIGLALVKGLIALHGGTIEGYSPGLGRGSQFTIHLPRSVLIPHRGTQQMEPLRTPAATLSQFKVLVADDNRDAADSLALLLEMNGHEVVVVHGGEDAVRMAGQAFPDAAILDIGMPDITGYEVARRIRAEPWGQHMFLIAVTGWGQKEDKARANSAGFDYHLTKPVDLDQIEKLLQSRFQQLDRAVTAG
jgi:signal transduction histidine kinase/ActR/RegA family two-component response regulator